MGQALSIDDADHTRAKATRSAVNNSASPRGSRAMPGRSTSRVPMLDWSTQLFNDNATMAELDMEDLSPADMLAFAPRTEVYAQAAA